MPRPLLTRRGLRRSGSEAGARQSGGCSDTRAGRDSCSGIEDVLSLLAKECRTSDVVPADYALIKNIKFSQLSWTWKPTFLLTFFLIGSAHHSWTGLKPPAARCHMSLGRLGCGGLHAVGRLLQQAAHRGAAAFGATGRQFREWGGQFVLVKKREPADHVATLFYGHHVSIHRVDQE